MAVERDNLRRAAFLMLSCSRSHSSPLYGSSDSETFRLEIKTESHSRFIFESRYGGMYIQV